MGTNTREYQRLYMRKYVASRKKEAKKFLGGKCINCGTTKLLEFDHIDRGTKINNVSYFWRRSKKSFWQEVKKCQLLCPKCHREKGINSGDVGKAEHGSKGMYSHHKCRCFICTNAHKERTREYRAKKKLNDPYYRRIKPSL